MVLVLSCYQVDFLILQMFVNIDTTNNHYIHWLWNSGIVSVKSG